MHRIPVALAVTAIAVAGWVLATVERATRPHGRPERPRWPQ